MNVPAERLGLPPVTDRDREGLSRALELGADFVAQSFVRAPSDVRELRAAMGDQYVPIIAKIETRPAVTDIEGILVEADAVMIARGDLGVELPMEQIPLIQKELVRAAREAGRPAIVATQMLESMIHAPRPTRAETTDVANAVLDGADAVMLSGETAVGDYPFESALAASTIAGFVEAEGASFMTAQPPCRHTERGRGRRTRRRRDPGERTRRRRDHVLHGDRPHGQAPVGRAPAGAGLRVRPAARRPADHVSAMGRRGAPRRRRPPTRTA